MSYSRFNPFFFESSKLESSTIQVNLDVLNQLRKFED